MQMKIEPIFVFYTGVCPCLDERALAKNIYISKKFICIGKKNIYNGKSIYIGEKYSLSPLFIKSQALSHLFPA